MRTCGRRKITHGHVVQTFDNSGKCIEQEFVAGDHVEWEGDDLEPLKDDTDDCEYHTFCMVQPQLTVANETAEITVWYNDGKGDDDDSNIGWWWRNKDSASWGPFDVKEEAEEDARRLMSEYNKE